MPPISRPAPKAIWTDFKAKIDAKHHAVALTVDSLSGCDSFLVLVVVLFLVVECPRKDEDAGDEDGA